MALGIRGANPIWAEFDLQGNLFDDTFWMFVLENTIPYIPAKVYHDPDLNTEWTNPIQFLGNGTLPNDIYFESEKVYRLEFRQGPTQSDPLIYEVNNYIAGSGGSTPVDTVAFASSNQVTNPQFALINFGTPASPTFSLSATNPDPIELAPGWTLELAGTGTVTLTQVPLNNANSNPSNAPYALRLTLNGWTNDSVVLRQRFQQNGMLWANKIVSSAITARLDGSPQSITATLVDSNSALLATVLTPTPVNEEWNEFADYGELPATSNPNTPPAAYIDYRLQLPSNIDIYISSIQLVVQDLPLKPSFEQDSINRQIDHTYNTAYPIVPVGGVIDFAGFTVPLHFYLCDGAAKNRITDNLLFQALTTTETVTLTSGVNTFTVAANSNYHIGMALEGTGIAAATIITNIVGLTITMSNNATASGAQVVRFFAWGAGDGSTTFNTPNLLGYVTAGANGTALGAGVVNGVGLRGGANSVSIDANNLPAHRHAQPPGSAGFVGTGGAGSGPFAGTAGSAFSAFIETGDNTTTHTNLSIVQQTAMMKKIIRYQ